MELTQSRGRSTPGELLRSLRDQRAAMLEPVRRRLGLGNRIRTNVATLTFEAVVAEEVGVEELHQ
jgi:hypothetical protein